ncbi:MAG: hypothetical protein WBA45_10290 [Microthrixaceae bacterium]
MVRHHLRRKPRRPATRLATWSGRGALIVGIVCLGLGAITPAAGADNARIAAEARCDRVVSWVVQAVADTAGGKADSAGEANRVRTNEAVEVSYRPAGSEQDTGERSWTTVETSALNASNDFTFSGSFHLPDSVDSVEVRVLPRTDWADGSKAGSPRYAVATVPDECEKFPAVAVVTPNCRSGGAVVELKNAGSSTMDMEVTVDGVAVRKVHLAADTESSLVVPILAGTSSVVRVNAGDFVVAQRKVNADCPVEGPAASILERCPTHQAVVSARLNDDKSDSGATPEIVIRAAGTIVHKGELTAGKVFQRTLDLPTDEPVRIEVQIASRTAAIGEIGSCAGPVAGAVSCGGSGQIACAVEPPKPDLKAPPPPPPPLSIELGSGSLPVTGPWQRAVVLLCGGALLSVGGLALVADQRRRPRPSLLASSVDGYRRQWWS